MPDKEKYKYPDEMCRLIDTKPCSAWLIRFDDGTQILSLWDPSATIGDVVNFTKIRTKKPFVVGRVDVGEFVVSKCTHSYCGDSRWVDQDMYVVPFNSDRNWPPQ